MKREPASFLIILLKVSIIFFSVVFSFFIVNKVNAGSEDNISGYAWSSNVGWVSFNCIGSPDTCASSDYGVTIDETGLFSGYAWSENIGWISFDSSDLAGCPNALCEARHTEETGDVSGWAKVLTSDTWISLRGTDYGVHICKSDTDLLCTAISSPKTGKFVGYAWEDTYIGWLSFSGNNYQVAYSADISPPIADISLSPIEVNVKGEVNDLLTIDVSGSSDDIAITGVRFSSDEIQDDVHNGTSWDPPIGYYDWDNSSGDWHHLTQTMDWNFSSGGEKEVWAEVINQEGLTDMANSDVYVNRSPSSAIYYYNYEIENYAQETVTSWRNNDFYRYIYDHDSDGSLDSCEYYTYDNIVKTTTALESRSPCTDGIDSSKELEITVGGEAGNNCPSQGENACTLKVRCKDDDEVYSEYASMGYSIDWEPPTVGQISPPYAEEGVVTTFSASVSDNLKVYTCFMYVDKAPVGPMSISPYPCLNGESCTASIDYAFTSARDHDVHATCYDYLNSASGQDVIVVVGANNPPVITEGSVDYTLSLACNGYPNSLPGCDINFFVEATDPDISDILSYDWDFDDGETSDMQNPSHHYDTIDTYNVTVTVSDGRGGTDYSEILEIKIFPENQAPVCDISAPTTVAINTFISIGMSGSYDPDGSLEKIRFSSDNIFSPPGTPQGSWTGDYNWGPPPSGPEWNPITKIMQWSFAETGNYEVWAEVTDNTEQSTMCYKIINVKECWPPPGNTKNCTSDYGCIHTLACSAQGLWPEGVCGPDDECNPLDIQECGVDGEQVCNISCLWGECIYEGDCTEPAPSCPICQHPVCESASWSCVNDVNGTDCGDCKSCKNGSCDFDCLGNKNNCQCVSDSCVACSTFDPGGPTCGYGACSYLYIPDWSCEDSICQYECDYNSGCESEGPPEPEECEENSPLIGFSPTNKEGAVGDELSYVVLATNNDAGPCSDANLTLAIDVCPLGWNCLLFPTNMNNVDPQETRGASLSVESPLGTSKGEYYITISVTNENSGLINSGSVTYNVLNNAPWVTNTSESFIESCSYFAPRVTLTWDFNDTDIGDSQSAYRVQIDNQQNFNTPEYDTYVNSANQEYSPLMTLSDFEKNYYWRVMVWDSESIASEWSERDSFYTGERYPWPDFMWKPEVPTAKEIIQFCSTAISPCEDMPSASTSLFFDTNEEGRVFEWDFNNDSIVDNYQKNPIYIYPKASSPDGYPVTLCVTDGNDPSNGPCCQTYDVVVRKPLPEWIEAPPF